MSIPNHCILPMQVEDLPTIRYFVRISKFPLTINRLLFKDWPNEPAQIATYQSPSDESLKDPLIDSLKVIDDRSGEIVGHLVLQRKPPKKQEPPTEPSSDEDRDQSVPDGMEPAVLAAVMKTVTGISQAQKLEGVDHFDLIHIYVRPESRKQGIASQLVQVCLDKAKAAGVPLALCAEPVAHNVWLKRGFKDVTHHDIDLKEFAPAYCGFGIFRLSGMAVEN